MSIKKRGKGYVVTNKAGTRVLGRHKTRSAAVKQLQAVEINKRRGKR